MEHWQKVTIGTLGGLVATVIFYLIVGRLLDYFYIRNKKRRYSENVARPERFYSKKRGSIKNSELEKFIHEEFESSRHEVIIVIASTHKRSAAVCAFLQEMKVEFFVEKFPDCCLQHFASNNSSKQEIIDQAEVDHEATLRSVLSAVSLWSTKWALADSINLLSQNQRFVIEANDGESSSAKFLKQFEEKFDFRVFTQWTENYVCDHSANEEMWESLTECTKELLRVDDDLLESASDLASNDVWSDFICEQWPRSRITLTNINFHQLPHPGQISPDRSKIIEKLIEFE